MFYLLNLFPSPPPLMAVFFCVCVLYYGFSFVNHWILAIKSKSIDTKMKVKLKTFLCCCSSGLYLFIVLIV